MTWCGDVLLRQENRITHYPMMCFTLSDWCMNSYFLYLLFYMLLLRQCFSFRLEVVSTSRVKKPRADINSPRRCRNRAAVQRSIQLRRQIPTLALTCSKKLKRHVLSHRTRVLCWAAGSGTVSTFCAAVFPWAMCLAAGRAAFSQTECNTKLKRMPPGLTWECLLATAWMYRLVTIKGTTPNKPGGREQL